MSHILYGRRHRKYIRCMRSQYPAFSLQGVLDSGHGIGHVFRSPRLLPIDWTCEARRRQGGPLRFDQHHLRTVIHRLDPISAKIAPQTPCTRILHQKSTQKSQNPRREFGPNHLG